MRFSTSETQILLLLVGVEGGFVGLDPVTDELRDSEDPVVPRPAGGPFCGGGRVDGAGGLGAGERGPGVEH